jgi:uncharacterized protein (DUF2252 family)
MRGSPRRGAVPHRQFSGSTPGVLEFVTGSLRGPGSRAIVAPVPPPDPVALADEQLERDKTVTARFPGLFERKQSRMAASPLAYLRGAAPLFYRLLAEHPDLASGPEGEGWLSGDLHLENFGVYRTDRGEGISNRGATTEEDPVVFDINDFDETFVGPFRFDVLRLVTSLILGGRELGVDGPELIRLASALLDAYAAASFGGGPLPSLPVCIRHLLEKVEGRSHRDLLERRTAIVKGSRKFLLGDRYAELPPALAQGAVSAFEQYVAALPQTGLPKERVELLDVAFRIAGTGSLGALRVAVLTRGKGGTDGAWIFDMKEEGAVSAGPLAPPLSMPPASRVAAGFRACVEHPPRMIGTTTLGESSLFVRRLSPQEDKLDLTRLGRGDLAPLAAYLGALVGLAHRRGATKALGSAWSRPEQTALIDKALVLAGIHETSYLAMCRVAYTRAP